jgi:hypothetical protein
MPSAMTKCEQCGRELHLESLIDAAESGFGLGLPVRQVHVGGAIREEVEAIIDAEIAKKGGTILVKFHRSTDSERLPEPGQIEVKVPAGVATGARLRLRGAGKAGCDLYVLLRVKAETPRLCMPCQMEKARPKMPVAPAIIGLAILVVLGLLRGCTR